MLKKFTVLVFYSCILFVVCNAYAIEPEAAKDFIQKLYKTYEWETQDGVDQHRKSLNDRSPEILMQYFDSRMVNLFLKEAAMLSYEPIGCIDFVILWDSQDPSTIKKIMVKNTIRPEVVVVELSEMGRNIPNKIYYYLTQTETGLRIHDIEYASNGFDKNANRILRGFGKGQRLSNLILSCLRKYKKTYPLMLVLTGQKTFKNSIGMEFVLIPLGSFQMGSNSGTSDEKPMHKVTIERAFYMGKTEVTQAQWKAVMGNNPSYFKGDDLPVDSVSWNDAKTFIQKLNAKENTDKYRLPSEAEWEYAARAGSTTKWHFGDDESLLGDYAWYDENSGNKTHAVAGKKPNKYGLYDMVGNVWEWTCSEYGAYSENKENVCSQSISGQHVLRGGSWDGEANDVRSANRNADYETDRYFNLGFRLISP
jgi:formylglycine-generating enzyme required for sulfatase activity